MRDKAALPNTRLIPAEEWGPGYELWNGVMSWLGQRGPDGTTSLVRVASHLVIVAVAVLVLWFSRVNLPEWEIVQAPSVAPPTAEEAAAQAAAPANGVALPGNLVRAPVPFTLIPERPRTDFIRYTVVAGDTLYDIADRYHISADTLVWTNGLEENPDLLRLGQQLIILPVNGLIHEVKPGDTLESIAKTYSAKVADIVGFDLNQMDAQKPAITVGQKLVVPGGVKPAPPPKPAPAPAAIPQAQIAKAPANAPRGGGRFVWPTGGSITQRFQRYHPALDIASYIGAPVKSADAGYIAEAGWSSAGYGYHIIVDHGNGYSTLYAHLSKILVKAGQTISAGQLIGNVGSTGRSTGPHLHFEVRLNGVGQNPFNYLP